MSSDREAMMYEATLTTVECGRPGDAYTLLHSGPVLDVHLARILLPSHGTGPCLCGFDRHGEKVGFSVGGGTTGPHVQHEVCSECARLADGPIKGLHAKLFDKDWSVIDAQIHAGAEGVG